MIGPKLLAGLRAYSTMDLMREYTGGDCGLFADERLEGMGYPPKVADSIIERLHRKGWIEYGVSARSGWLTHEGRDALRAAVGHY